MGRPSKYPKEFRVRAARLVREWRAARGVTMGGIREVATQLGIHHETPRNWINQGEVDAGEKPGSTTEDKARISELEREVRELRRANEILKAASAFFARELDPRPPR
ncbi:MAG: transposase [Acidimicrobiia bacterium]